MKKPTVFYYILGQIIPTFLIGIMIFIFILLMFQFLKLTEFILVHDVSIQTISLIIVNLSVSFLPIILPMSLLFSVLLTYSRLSADSEVVALKAVGYSPLYLSTPAIVFSFLISILSIQTLFNLGPAARLNFDKLLNRIGNQKVMSSISEGTFSESFFDLVLYTNDIDQSTNTMRDLFIYDQRNPKNPIAIVAKEGIISNTTDQEAQSANILLKDGDIYQLGTDAKTKLNFSTYKINISDPITHASSHQDTDTYTMTGLEKAMDNENLPLAFRKVLLIEKHRRWAIAVSCLMFGFLGAALGSRTNRRSSASTGFIVSVLCIMSYWVLYMVGNNIARSEYLPPAIALWLPNYVFLLVTIWAWQKQYKTA